MVETLEIELAKLLPLKIKNQSGIASLKAQFGEMHASQRADLDQVVENEFILKMELERITSVNVFRQAPSP